MRLAINGEQFRQLLAGDVVFYLVIDGVAATSDERVDSIEVVFDGVDVVSILSAIRDNVRDRARREYAGAFVDCGIQIDVTIGYDLATDVNNGRGKASGNGEDR